MLVDPLLSAGLVLYDVCPTVRLVSVFLKFGPARDVFDNACLQLQTRGKAPDTSALMLYDCLVQVATEMQRQSDTLSLWSKHCNHGGVARTMAGGYLSFFLKIGLVTKLNASGSVRSAKVLTLGESRGNYLLRPFQDVKERLQLIINAGELLKTVSQRPPAA